MTALASVLYARSVSVVYYICRILQASLVITAIVNVVFYVSSRMRMLVLAHSLQHVYPPRVREKHRQCRARKHPAASEAQLPERACPLSHGRRSDAREPAPEARESRRAASHGRRERFGRPRVQHRVERALDCTRRQHTSRAGGEGRNEQKYSTALSATDCSNVVAPAYAKNDAAIAPELSTIAHFRPNQGTSTSAAPPSTPKTPENAISILSWRQPQPDEKRRRARTSCGTSRQCQRSPLRRAPPGSWAGTSPQS
jgi:hypothetical protein